MNKSKQKHIQTTKPQYRYTHTYHPADPPAAKILKTKNSCLTGCANLMKLNTLLLRILQPSLEVLTSFR